MNQPTAGRPSSELRIEWTTELAQIRQLRQLWLELQERVQRRTVYSDHDWIVAWYEAYGGTKYAEYGHPLVGTAWHNGQLVGVAPLIIVRSRLARIPLLTIKFAGYNLQAGEILALDGRPAIASEMLRSIARHREWELASLLGLQLDWEHVRLLRDTATGLGLLCEVTEDDAYAVADLRDGYQSYIMKRSGHFRQNLKRYARKMAAAGGAKLDRMSRQAGPTEVESYLTRILAIAKFGWRARERGLQEERNHHPFISRVLRAFGHRQMLDVTILTINRKDAAYCVGLVERGQYFHIVMGFVEDLRNLSPSAFMLQELFKSLSEEGIAGVLSHGEYDYKRHWASDFVPQKRLLIFGRAWRSRFSHFARFRLLPRLARDGWSRSRQPESSDAPPADRPAFEAE